MPSKRWASAVLVLLAAVSVLGQSGSGKLSAGQLLVASRNVTGATFAESVILLVQYDEKGAMGLVMNRPSDIPVSRALFGLDAAKGRSEPIYIGGPVGRTGVLALLRSPTAPASGTEVLPGVHLISSRALLETSLASDASADDLRIYLGYAGWGAGQLDREVASGYWHKMPATPELVFDPRPTTLWPRLISRTEVLLAGFSAVPMAFRPFP